MSRYSMDRKEKKIAGVCATLGDVFNLDPTFMRIGFIAIAILVSWKLALIGYIAAGIYLHRQKGNVLGRGELVLENREGLVGDHVDGEKLIRHVGLSLLFLATRARLELFPCCWVSLKRSAAAFSLRKAPIDAEALHYTYRETALAQIGELFGPVGSPLFGGHVV